MKIMDNLETIHKPTITHTQLVRYAGASGDFNPIHTVVPIGEKAGLGGVIAHGMLIMGLAGDAIGKWFPRRNLRKFNVRFSAMTRPGESLCIEGSIIDEIEVDGEIRYVGNITVKNPEGEKKLKGQFQVKKEI
ncbi:3-hydroxyacyl-ACP dehydratase [Heyndrickxia oleronia]|jgi:acyl dehydratase|uniref:MaoC/PaaZ C-terminal domain-containing protein n=2 Tax=Heyndrickxia oleronia TaxID=38875 RepID=A0AAW6SKX2_9BACI|nr:MaoC/PaaZ C-terminal domain-containing protein [Heyndrickxia oleronia]MCM3453762.1 3-hydroxyacyl-ACP dehydratase [Heyndrickxia oleronia]MDH5159385.1 MaoC/PaaZ C-terminal domain-containing protein [Heyndrickxia oleronia]